MKEKIKKLIKVSLIIISSLTFNLLIWVGWVALKYNNIQKTEEFSTIAELDNMFAELVADKTFPKQEGFLKLIH